MKTVFALAALVLAAAWPAAASADEIAIEGSNGTEGIASFEGTLNYDGAGTLIVSLTNTTTYENGGFITAVAFNLPDAAGITSVDSFSSSDPDFQELLNPVSASPFGTFETGASLGNSWLGSNTDANQPSVGTGAGETVEFTFEFSGTDLGAISAGDFLSELSEGNHPEALVVRFRGFLDENGNSVEPGSDKVPGEPVPEPTTLLLLGAGAAGLAWRVRSSRRKA